MNFNKQKVAIALSGGVDSSVAALLLKESGYDVVGISALMHDEINAHESVKNAEKIAQILNIKFEVLDIREKFAEKIVRYFETAYKTGLTPNPCTLCNRIIKWDVLANYAFEKFNADFYATGHYAIIKKENLSYRLYKAADEKKDQTYMLFNLSQEHLSKTLFPLGELTKPQIKEIAIKNNIPSAQNKESQDICFISLPNTTKKYLIEKFGQQEGNIVNINTRKILGKHQGAYLYTIGQRKGIGIAAEQPLYVVSSDCSTNTVYVGFKEDLYKKEFKIENINWQQKEFSSQPFKSMVKIRYNSPAKEATVIPEGEKAANIIFDEPQSAITPGQAGVFYDKENKFIIGGGWISF